jgi:hypothetical protein
MGSAENGQRRLQSGRGDTIAGPGERQRLILLPPACGMLSEATT